MHFFGPPRSADRQGLWKWQTPLPLDVHFPPEDLELLDELLDAGGDLPGEPLALSGHLFA